MSFADATNASLVLGGMTKSLSWTDDPRGRSTDSQVNEGFAIWTVDAVTLNLTGLNVLEPSGYPTQPAGSYYSKCLGMAVGGGKVYAVGQTDQTMIDCTRYFNASSLPNYMTDILVSRYSSSDLSEV